MGFHAECSDDPQKPRSPEPAKRLESGNLRHKCPHCLTAFATKGALRRHGCVLRDLFRFRCESCGTSFASEATYIGHSCSGTGREHRG
ncbi:hypothetical protein IscW_ISCW014173 [Ixodes scapularis]|uniref:C2H2-type domain-containing protein n=1 Tax=Ixodes scapularis TaxID=6945 RepID=B7QLE6_IXOSC|nr:hypothetical protein IscW_ISCW014173 [Ixodes scapularis]|eukprot:XP_002416001.1 hypothetical protein IscW_ISCW014173 [Ixodes scapularis]